MKLCFKQVFNNAIRAFVTHTTGTYNEDYNNSTWLKRITVNLINNSWHRVLYGLVVAIISLHLRNSTASAL